MRFHYTPFTRVLVPICGSWQRNWPFRLFGRILI